MVANVTNALAAYSAAATRPVTTGMAPRDGDGPSFGEVMEQAAKNAIATVKKSENLSAQAVVGKADLTEVVNAVTNAEITLQTVTSVRDKVISAYQEILRMPI